MIIQTIQPLSVLENIEKNGIVFSMPNYSIYDPFPTTWGFEKAYAWMKKQMILKGVIPYQNEKDIFWAWAYANNSGKKQVDLRFHRRQYNKSPYVLLTLEKENKDICLSDFELWHFVLNYWAICHSEKESDIWDLKCKNHDFNFYNQKPLINASANAEIEKTWDTIFKIKMVNDYFLYDLEERVLQYLESDNRKLTVQATFWNIKHKDILKIQHIKN